MEETKCTLYLEWGNDKIISTNFIVNFSQYNKGGKLLKTSVKRGNVFAKMKSAKFYRINKT